MPIPRVTRALGTRLFPSRALTLKTQISHPPGGKWFPRPRSGTSAAKEQTPGKGGVSEPVEPSVRVSEAPRPRTPVEGPVRSLFALPQIHAGEGRQTGAKYPGPGGLVARGLPVKEASWLGSGRTGAAGGEGPCEWSGKVSRRVLGE